MLYLPKLNQIVSALNACIAGCRGALLVKLSQKLERKKVRFTWWSPIDMLAESPKANSLARTTSTPNVKKHTSSVEAGTAVSSLQFEWVMLVVVCFASSTAV
jgi:hypothetical protein